MNFLDSWYWKYELPEGKQVGPFTPSAAAVTDYFVYARRGVAKAKSSDTDIVDLTVRARPWGGTAGVQQMDGNQPGGKVEKCQEGKSFGVGSPVAGVKLPWTTCESVAGTAPNPAQPFEFGSDWGGETDLQIAIEAIASYKVAEGASPSFADYIWATFDPGSILPDNRDVRWTDAGW